MRNTIRGFRNLRIYLLPAFLLATAGVLLMGLLYYPVPSNSAGGEHQAAAVADEAYWRAHAEDLFAILLADALSQLRQEQDGRARTLRYQYEQALPSGECPALSPTTPPFSPGGSATNRSPLIHL